MCNLHRNRNQNIIENINKVILERLKNSLNKFDPLKAFAFDIYYIEYI